MLSSHTLSTPFPQPLFALNMAAPCSAWYRFLRTTLIGSGDTFHLIVQVFVRSLRTRAEPLVKKVHAASKVALDTSGFIADIVYRNTQIVTGAPLIVVCMDARNEKHASSMLTVVDAIGKVQRDLSIHSVCPVFAAWPTCIEGDDWKASWIMPRIGYLDLDSRSLCSLWSQGMEKDVRVDVKGASHELAMCCAALHLLYGLFQIRSRYPAFQHRDIQARNVRWAISPISHGVLPLMRRIKLSSSKVTTLVFPHIMFNDHCVSPVLIDYDHCVLDAADAQDLVSHNHGDVANIIKMFGIQDGMPDTTELEVVIPLLCVRIRKLMTK